MAPTGAGGKCRDAHPLGQIHCRKNPDLLAEEETADDAEPERRQSDMFPVESIGTPALAKAKMGNTRKATQGDSARSMPCSSECRP